MARAEIALRIDRSVDALDARRRYLHQPARTLPQRPWTAGEDAFLRAAAVARVPTEEIAQRLRRGTHAIRRRREILGATRPASRRYASTEDAALATALTEGRCLAELGEALGRTEAALRLRAAALGLITRSPRQRWAAIEDERLRRAYAAGLSIKQIRNRHLAARTEGAIVARAHLLGLALNARRWTWNEERQLEQLIATRTSIAVVARALGRSEEAIRNRSYRLGIPPPSSGRPRRSRPWTAPEDQLLRGRSHQHLATLSNVLDRSELAIRRRQRQLRIPRPERSQHHPTADTIRTEPERRLIAREAPLSPPRALIMSRRLRIPLAEIQRIAHQTETAKQA